MLLHRNRLMWWSRIVLFFVAGCSTAIKSPESSVRNPAPDKTESYAAGGTSGLALVSGQSFVDASDAVETIDEEADVKWALASEDSGANGLGLAQLEELALASNPAVAEAAAHVDAIRGKHHQVGLPPNPVLGYVGSEIGNEGRSGQQGAYVSQQIVTGRKLRLNRAVTSHEVDQAEQRLAAAQLRVRTDVRVGYYEVLLAQQRLEVSRRLAQTGRRGVEAVETLLRAKEAAHTELLQAKVEADSARIGEENATAALTASWQRLAVVVGDPEMPRARLAGNPRTDLPEIAFDETFRRLVTQSPEMGAAYAEVERARCATRRARAEVAPNVDVQAIMQQDASTGDAIAGLQVGVPVPVLNRNQGGIRQADAELVAAQQAVVRLELSLRRRLVSAFERYTIARQQVDRYGQDILPNVELALKQINEGYLAGEFSFLQLLTAQRTYFQTHLAYLDSLRDLWTAARQIDGLLLSDSLDADLAP